jgi:hypothetical protein
MMSGKWLCGLGVHWVVLGGAAVLAATPYVKNPDYPLTLDCPLYFVVDKEGASLYADANTPSTAKTVKIGELYCAEAGPSSPTTPAEQNSRYHIGRLDKYGDFKEEGWIAKADLLSGVRPITVAKVVDLGIVTASGQGEQAFSPQNNLPLKIVCKPEVQMPVSPKPGEQGELKALKFTWFHVFDAEQAPDGAWWYLIGKASVLKAVETQFVEFTKGGLAADVEASGNLLGWVPRASVQEWPSNLVLEYNTDKNALETRFNNKQPAQVYAEPLETSEVMAKEPLDAYWGEYFKAAAQYAGAQDWHASFRGNGATPIGLNPEYARFHVIERRPDGWTHAATLGSASGVSMGEIVEIQKRINQAYNELRKVDFVFVVDATGSMSEEINAVRSFLESLCQKFANTNTAGAPAIGILVGDQKLEFARDLDIRVGLVSYQDVGAAEGGSPYETKLHFAGRTVKGDAAPIQGAFADLTQDKLTGGTEAIHAGLMRALLDGMSGAKFGSGPDAAGSSSSASSASGEGAITRFICLVADESGDSGDEAQQRVFDAMPLPAGASSDLAADEAKRSFTQIVGLYTDADPNSFAAFSNNLRMVTDVARNVVQATNFALATPGENQTTLLEDLIADKFEEVANQVQSRLDLLAQTLASGGGGGTTASTTTTGVNTQNASVLMDQWAVEEALKKAGISREQLASISNDLAFIEGWIKEKDYSTAVLMELREAQVFNSGLTAFSASLERAIKGQGDPQQIVIRALAETTFMLSNGGAQLPPDRMEEEIKKVEEQLQKPNSTVGSVLGLAKALPIDPKGLLAMDYSQLKALTVQVLSDLIRDFRRKQICVNLLQQNKAIPADLVDVDQWTEEKQFRRPWQFTPPQSVVPYLYLPQRLVP